MNLVEVAYQLRGLVGHIVGSEEVEPGDGWPYDAVVRDLVASPDAEPADVAASLVQSYLDSYAGDESVTQSALDLSRVAAVAQAVDELAAASISALDTIEGYARFSRALKHTQRFRVKDFADLGDFCTQLIAESSETAVQNAARRVVETVAGDSPFVVAAGTKGAGVERATGTAVYFPFVGDVQVAYEQLDFAHDTRWDALIRAYQEV
jgi:hypothetical protein